MSTIIPNQRQYRVCRCWDQFTYRPSISSRVETVVQWSVIDFLKQCSGDSSYSPKKKSLQMVCQLIYRKRQSSTVTHGKFSDDSENPKTLYIYSNDLIALQPLLRNVSYWIRDQIAERESSESNQEMQIYLRIAGVLFLADPIRFWYLDLSAFNRLEIQFVNSLTQEMTELQTIRNKIVTFSDALASNYYEYIWLPSKELLWLGILFPLTKYNNQPTEISSYESCVCCLEHARNFMYRLSDVNSTIIRALSQRQDLSFRKYLIKKLMSFNKNPKGARRVLTLEASKSLAGMAEKSIPTGSSTQFDENDIPGCTCKECLEEFKSHSAVSYLPKNSSGRIVYFGLMSPETQTSEYSQIQRLDGSTIKTDITIDDEFPYEVREDGTSSFDDFEEERISKIRALFVILHLHFLRDITQQAQSEFSASSLNTTSESSEGNTPEKIQDTAKILNDKNSESSESVQDGSSSSSGSILDDTVTKVHLGSRKRLVTDEEEKDNKEGQEPPPKNLKRRKKDLSGRYLACPYAKGNPSLHISCLIIGRKNLSGVKEHVKRNHSDNNILPINIRKAKSWDAVFGCCFPHWNINAYPAPYLDELEWYKNSLAWNSSGFTVSQPSTQAAQEQCRDNTSHITPLFDTMSTDADRPENDQGTSSYDQNPETSELQVITPTLYDMAAQTVAGTTPSQGISESLDAFLKILAEPHIRWPLSGSDLEDYHQSKIYYEDSLGIDMKLPPAEQYQMMVAAFEQKGDSIDALPAASDIFDGSQGADVPYAHVSFEPNVNSSCDIQINGNDLILINELSDKSTSSNGYRNYGGTSLTSSRCSGVVQNKGYTLFVSRNPIIHTSAESQGQKKFCFDKFDEFYLKFEPWMSSVFTDPLFNWDTMHLFSDKRGAKLVTIDEVADEVEVLFIKSGTRKAALDLVMKKADNKSRKRRRVSDD